MQGDAQLSARAQQACGRCGRTASGNLPATTASCRVRDGTLAGMRHPRIRPAPALAATLVATGLLHFATPAPFDTIVPRALPGAPRRWTYLSGAAELAVAAAVTLPRTRRLGGLTAAALFVAVFPANVQMALDWRRRSPAQRTLAWGRLPLQLPLLAWALRASRDTPPCGVRFGSEQRFTGVPDSDSVPNDTPAGRQ